VKTIFTSVKIMVSCPKCETQVEYSSSAEFQKCTWTQECGATFKVPKIELADASTKSEKWETTVLLPVPGWAEMWEVANQLSHLIRDHFSDDPYYDKPFYPQNWGQQIRLEFKAFNEAQAHTIAALSRKFLAQFDNVNGADVSVSNEALPF
jgi:hypothetical protein